MSNLEIELQALKENLLEMMGLASKQIELCKEATISGDLKLAEQVIENEKRLNALELTMDKDCENILALHNPVATDLRFVLAVLKITGDLERIGDNAKNIATFLVKNSKKLDKNYLEKFGIGKMYEISISMLSCLGEALKKDDADLARKTFKEDELLNKKNKSGPKIAAALIEEDPKQAKLIVRLLAVVNKLERVGDLAINIAEEVVFHVEAKVLKHNKDKS
ncbi:MAG: phosphate signaling complex protein PhoU [Cyclobacteriaceae bacterium]|jgi:phosphate transport system protein|nr:phosphate signaling complex protein PhoU [Cyclobacteriaceae bacterium]